MADQSTCMSPLCGITIEGNDRKCPKCGWVMRNSANIRMRGWFLLVLGLFLVLFMGYITWAVLPTLMQPGDTYDGNTFRGTAQQANLILALFALIIGFGAAAGFNGMYMIISGRQNRWFVALIFLLFIVVWGAAWLATRTLK